MAVRGRGRCGKIRALVDLTSRHRTAFAYDWRTRFGLPLSALYDGRMTWAEAWDLTAALGDDPTSHVGAALAGWQHPFSHEALILADLYDLTLSANTDRAKRARIRPYPRPFETNRDREKSRRPNVSQAVVRATLAAMGH